MDSSNRVSSWIEEGNYFIRVKAKEVIGLESDWEGDRNQYVKEKSNQLIIHPFPGESSKDIPITTSSLTKTFTSCSIKISSYDDH